MSCSLYLRRGLARTLVAVFTQRQLVDYALRRRAVLADLRAGRVTVAQVCDADPYLLRAAAFHGSPGRHPCPVCRKEQVTEVSWVYGESLGRASGSARAEDEIAGLAAATEEFSVHVVEVCRTCSWNHLVRSYTTGRPPRPKARRARM